MLKEKNPEIKKAVVVLEQLSEDEQTRALAEAREKMLRDEYARLETAEQIGEERGIEIGEERGIQIGEERGIEIGKKETAKKLLEIQMSIDDISKITGLNKDEIEELQNEEI